jgi:hypothetical protein
MESGGDQVKENEIGGNVARMREIRMYKIFWLGNLKRRDHSEDLGVDGKITDLKEIGWKILDWILLAQDKE